MSTRILSLLAVFAISGNAQALSKSPPKGHLGSEWEARNGDLIHPQLGLSLIEPAPTADVFRSEGFDWRNSNIQQGPYPPKALKADKEGVVPLRLTVDVAGKIKHCEVDGTSGLAELDGHACPHLMRTVRLYPALGADGKRLERTISAQLSYELRLRITTFAEGGAVVRTPKVRAKQNGPISLESLGLASEVKKLTGTNSFAAWVKVSPDGRPESCRLVSPTYDDGIDALVCNTLMQKTTYSPARDATGNAVADTVNVFLSW